MLKQDRFLTGILIGIAALVIIVIVVFFTRQDQQVYINDDSPEGVVHNYVLALQQRDYEKAYDYLADMRYKPDYETFKRDFITNRTDPTGRGLKVGSIEMHGDEAYIEMIIIHIGSGPFSDPYSYSETAALLKQDGEWKIIQMPYPFWMWGWYAEPQPSERND